MAKFSVSKSIQIHAPIEKVYSVISDLNQWRQWSPWLVTEPEAEVNVAPDGKSYTWNGKRVGEGQMVIQSESPPNNVNFDLTFLKPWKSQSKVRFELSQTGNQTRVTWIMDSSLPFFMFFMKQMMITLIGMDYERGLSMLKDYAETGSVPTKMTLDGLVEQNGCSFVGIATECKIPEVGEKMSSDFEKLSQWIKSSGVSVSGNPFSVYRKWDMKNGRVNYVSGFPVKNVPDSVPEEFMKGNLPDLKAYCITHTGPYRHLGNAWSTGMSLGRSKVFKQNKKLSPFEVYINEPGQVPENELETRVFFPVLK